MLMRAAALAAAAAALAASSGCVSPVDGDGRIRHRQFEVAGSGLDWMEFVYSPAPGSGAIPFVCRLELYGSGMARLRIGPSPQVLNDFAANHSDAHWNDMVVEQAAMTPEQMRAVMQVFVDEGVVAEFPQKLSAAGLPSVSCAGTVNTEKFRLVTDNGLLVDAVADFIETNFAAALRRAAAFAHTGESPQGGDGAGERRSP